MSSDPSAPTGGPISDDPSGQAQQPSEEELRAAYEAELSRISSADMILQAAVSLLNLGGRRLGLAPGAEGARDLGQVRDAIDAVRALLEILERSVPQELRPLRDALAQLQMAYAREAQAGAGAGQSAQPGSPTAGPPAAEPSAGEPSAGDGPAAPAAPSGPGAQPPGGRPGAGPAESSGRLWVPGR